MPIVADFIGTPLTSGTPLITGSGVLRAILSTVDHNSLHSDIVFYDNTAASGTVLLTLHVHPGPPIHLTFDRDDSIRFATGLTADFTGIAVNVWAVQLT